MTFACFWLILVEFDFVKMPETESSAEMEFSVPIEILVWLSVSKPLSVLTFFRNRFRHGNFWMFWTVWRTLRFHFPRVDTSGNWLLVWSVPVWFYEGEGESVFSPMVVWGDSTKLSTGNTTYTSKSAKITTHHTKYCTGTYSWHQYRKT